MILALFRNLTNDESRCDRKNLGIGAIREKATYDDQTDSAENADQDCVWLGSFISECVLVAGYQVSSSRGRSQDGRKKYLSYGVELE